jgi:predicted unusual protein kinase regulating ubiquinone biosynthesis (AarF/ABC1/UbiB family)
MKKLNIDTAQVANNLIQIFLYQMITMGYVHCDPHPGNLGLYNDGETIVLYDYGNCIKFSNKFKKNLSQLIFSIYQRDVNEFVELMIELDILNIKDEYEILEVKSFFNYFFKYLENLDFNDLKKDIVKNDIKSGFQANLRINPSFLSLFRIFSLMDGTCSLLDKNFNYITAIGPYAQEIMNDVEFFNYRIKKDFSKIRSYPTIMQTNEGNILKLNKNISNINKDLQKTQIMVILLMISLYNINYSPFMFIIYVVYLINFK